MTNHPQYVSMLNVSLSRNISKMLTYSIIINLIYLSFVDCIYFKDSFHPPPPQKKHFSENLIKFD